MPARGGINPAVSVCTCGDQNRVQRYLRQQRQHMTFNQWKMA
jgi:hypothetical protein